MNVRRWSIAGIWVASVAAGALMPCLAGTCLGTKKVRDTQRGMPSPASLAERMHDDSFSLPIPQGRVKWTLPRGSPPSFPRAHPSRRRPSAAPPSWIGRMSILGEVSAADA